MLNNYLNMKIFKGTFNLSLKIYMLYDRIKIEKRLKIDNIEKENKRLKVLIVVLLLLLIGAGVYIYCTNFIKSDDNNKEETIINENIIYSYEDMERVYTIKKTVYVDKEKIDRSCSLYLWKDGTFKLEYNGYAPYGYIGNYIIDNNYIEIASAGECATFDFSGDLEKMEKSSANELLETYKLNNYLDKADDIISRAEEERKNNT